VSRHFWIDRLNPWVVRYDTGVRMRCYRFAYLAGFLLTGWIPLRWARKEMLPIKEEEVPTIVLYSAWEVMIAGRHGYRLAYLARKVLLSTWKIFALWHGSMPSHGGVAGPIIGLWALVRQYAKSMLPLPDAAHATVPVAIAIFINGELWARPISAP
jgi:prolipoprotein diacylglyceryltransferase